MSGVQSSASDIDVDLGRLFGSLAMRWKRILSIALAVTALALLFVWFATPHYKGETRILIETRESIFTRPQQSGEGDRPLLDEEGVTSQVQVITSTDLLKQVAVELELARLPEFDEAADMSILSRLLIVAGLRSDPNEIPPEERVLKAFREKLNVYRVENSRVIVIEMSSQDPKLAAAIPNALADAYIAAQGAAKRQSNSEATDWLEPEIANLSKRVKEAESRVADFRAQSGLLIGQNDAILATQQLSELSTELSRVRANRGAAEANAESVRAILNSGASLDALPEVLSSPLIQRLREREVQLKADIADLSTTLLDNHPRIRALRSQLADLDRQIRTEAENVLKALGSEANAAQMREKQLIADLNELKAESARAGEEQVELRALEREANAQRELLESYLARYREASSRRDGNYLPADARIFSRAIVPAEPYFPKPLPIAGAAFVGSLLVMAIVTLLQELFSGRAMRPAAGSRLRDDTEAAESHAKPVAAEATGREEPHGPASAESAAIEPVVIERAGGESVAVEPEPEIAAAAEEVPAVPVEPKPALAEEMDLSRPAVAVPVFTDIVPAPGAIEPARHGPLPEMKVERESFSEAWARHRRIMDAAKHEAVLGQPTEDHPDEASEHAHDKAEHDEIREESTMRNPFASRKPAPGPEETEP
ncbi:MAG: GumC family protein, partial [Pseudomonadota bacterium]|nr:GumC family protein [Pseudomonadota bacterium]